MEKNSLPKWCMIIITLLTLTSCTSLSKPSLAAKPSFAATNPAAKTHTDKAENTAFWQASAHQMWARLQRTPASKLEEMQSKSTNETMTGWVELARLARQKNLTTQQLADELLAWRRAYPSHPANPLFPEDAVLAQLQTRALPRQIAILLPESGHYGRAGQTVRAGFLNAYYANRSKDYQQNIKFYDTSKNPSIAAVYQKAIADGADFIIGPLAKENVQQLNNAETLEKPTLALNYTENGVNAHAEKLYEFGLLPEDETTQIANRAHEMGRLNALIIAPQNAWGKRLTAAFTTRWQALGGQITDTLYYTARVNFNQEVARLLKVNPEADKKLMQENNNKTLLEKQRRNDFDVIFLFAQPDEAHLIVPLLRYYYVNNTPIFATSAVYSGTPDAAKDADLNGVTICDIPWKKARSADKEATSYNRLYAVGQDAYLLSESLERLKALPNFPLYGGTGALTLGSPHQIHRSLPCKTVRNGLL